MEELEGSDRGLRYRLNAVRNECDKYHTERDKLRREANELKQQVADLERKHGLAIAELNDALRRHDAYAVDAVGKQESFQRMIDRDKKLVDTWIEAAAAARKERIALQALLDAREDWRETETCGYCHGSGMTGEKCAYCNGTGVVVRREGATSG